MVFWQGIRKDIKLYVANCDICQWHKYSTLAPGGLLQLLPIPQQVWGDVSMDFISSIPKVRGKDTIMVLVDRLTKFAHFIPLGHPFSAKEVAQCFIEEIVRLHGLPSFIVLDKDRFFLSQFWTELFKTVGTTLKYSMAYHPQSDSQTEVTNHCLEAYLHYFAGEKPTQWPRWLPWVEYWFKTSYNASTKMTPFRVVYGRYSPVLFRGETVPSNEAEVQQLIKERHGIVQTATEQFAGC